MRNRLAWILGLVLFGIAAVAVAQYSVSNYREQGGARWVIGGSLDVVSGGDIDIESGGALKIAGSDKTTILARPGRSSFNICGEATTVNNNTVYYGAADDAGGGPIILGDDVGTGQLCSIDAAGSTTEANEDEYVFTNQAVAVLSMVCRNEADANADISFTLRTAAGATVPSVTCTIADGERDCVADIQTTTDIAAGATVALAVASTSDVGDNNGFVCQVEVAF